MPQKPIPDQHSALKEPSAPTLRTSITGILRAEIYISIFNSSQKKATPQTLILIHPFCTSHRPYPQTASVAIAQSAVRGPDGRGNVQKADILKLVDKACSMASWFGGKAVKSAI